MADDEVGTACAGSRCYPADAARAVLRSFVGAHDRAGGADDAPSAVSVVALPAVPGVPGCLAGRRAVVVRRVVVPSGAGQAVPIPALVASARFETFHENAIDVVLDATRAPAGRQPDIALAELRAAARGGFVLHLAAVPTVPDAVLALEARLRHVGEALHPYVARCGTGGPADGSAQDDDSPCPGWDAPAVRWFEPCRLDPLRRARLLFDPALPFGLVVDPAQPSASSAG